MRLFGLLKIFEMTSNIVEMMIQVLKDIDAFLLVLVISEIAFGQAFQVLAANQPFETLFFQDIPEFTFTISLRYVFLLTGGMAEPNVNEENFMLWIIFFAAVLLNLILMLNLLIAIICKSFDTVTNDRNKFVFNTRA